MLCEKYAPTTLNGIIGNDIAVSVLHGFAEKVQNGEHVKPLMLFGPPGTGKTAAARALAYSNSFEILELTASDYRDTANLNKTIIPASRSKGLFGKTILILLDEIDETSKKYDSGVERVVGTLIRNSRQPVIFTAEDYWDQSIRFLRNSVEKVEFKKVGTANITKLLKEIVTNENAKIDDEVVDALAKRSDGDVRGAINDLEAMLGADRKLMESIGIRDKKMEVFKVLDKIFLSSNFEIARNAMTKSDVDIEMVMNWVDENIPNRYTSRKGVDDAYENLAVASRFYEKANRTNYWGYLRYASVLMSSGVAVSSDGFVRMLRPYSFPSKIRYMGSTKEDRSVLNGIADKLGDRFHTSRRKIIRDYVPLLKAIFDNSVKEIGKESAFSQIEAMFGMDKEDIGVIIAR